jgi:hypothetical protein
MPERTITMKLKLDENGNAVLQDGKPVYIHEDGKESAFDAAATVATISRLNHEAKSHREAKEKAEAALKSFEGIEDAEAARRAMETVKNLDDKKLVDAGEIENVKKAAVKAHEEQTAAAAKAHADELKKLTAERDEILDRYNTEKVAVAFRGSKFIAEKFAIPADLVESRFGGAFKVEDGKIVAYDGANNKIYSRAKPGDLADFDEALEALVDQYPYKEQVLKGTGSSGTGAKPGTGTGEGAKSKGNFGGTREERQAAIKAQYPELAKQG